MTGRGEMEADHGEERHLTMGDLGRAIGRYTESEGGDSEETLAAHRGLFAIYDRWVDEGRPETSGYDRIRGWMGVEDDEGRVALTQRAEAALQAEPFPVFRRHIGRTPSPLGDR